MRVYFVRHGATEYNKRHIHQPPKTALSEVGILQAKQVAHFLKQEGVDHIFSSDLPRTKKTAEIIAEETQAPITTLETLREIRRPQSLYRRSHFHPRSFWYVLQTIFHHRNPVWHYHDGESLYELKKRATSVVRHLESVSTAHSNIAVVSHAVFLEILISFLCKQDVSFADYFPVFSPLSPIKNSSVSIFEYIEHENSNVCTWLPVTYNDTKHLAK